MKHRKKILALLLVAIMAFGTFTVFASEAEGGLPSAERTALFHLMEAQEDGDVFSMISYDGDLIIHINEETPVIFEDDTDARERLEEGQTLAELLDNRTLVITYSIVAQSMPPQTTPEKVVIMYETAVHLPGVLDVGDLDLDDIVLNGEVVVDGEIIEAPAPFLNEDGVVMVPLRAMAEAIGYDVNWDPVVRGIRLGVAINLWVGQDEYHVGRMAPISLGTAPVIVEDRTFVPMTFFRDVIAGFDIYVFEGQVVLIDSELNDMQ